MDWKRMDFYWRLLFSRWILLAVAGSFSCAKHLQEDALKRPCIARKCDPSDGTKTPTIYTIQHDDCLDVTCHFSFSNLFTFVLNENKLYTLWHGMLTKFRELMRLNVCEMCISLVKLMFTCLSSLTMCLLGCVCVCVYVWGFRTAQCPHSCRLFIFI